MTLLQALRDWQSFYVVTGGAAAALVGLMFVAVSLGSHLVTDEQMEGIRTYVNPTLFHFVVAFVIACAILVPTHSLVSLSVIIGLVSVIGLWQSVRVVQRMRSRPSEEVNEDNHWLWHGWLPLLSYTIGCAVAIGLAISGLPDWLNGLALMIVTVIVCAIRNTWVLILWIARQR